MRIWKEINEEKPSKSGMYRVKADSKLFTIKCAYYDLLQDIWSYDDGSWLPMDITLYITHWTELNKQ